MENAQLAVISSNDLLPSTMEAAIEFSTRMAEAKLVPVHLQKSPADCLRVVLQAARWQMDPFAVADKTSVISGKLMYEGQLMSAVVNSRGKLSKRLEYDFEGEGQSRTLTVRGTVQGEDKERTIILTHALASKINRNGQMSINPDQQMCYIGSRMWARRHTPELMLGVYVPDEMDEDPAPGAEPKNVTPPPVRPDPAALRKGRKATGVAASKEPEPAVDVNATPAGQPAGDGTAHTVSAEAPAETATPAKVTLEKDKQYTWPNVRIVSAKCEDFGSAGKPRYGCKAEIDCEHFTGTVYDLAGGKEDPQATADGTKMAGKLLPIWKAGHVVTLKVTGKFSKVQKVVIGMVDEITKQAVPEVEPEPQGLGVD